MSAFLGNPLLPSVLTSLVNGPLHKVLQEVDRSQVLQLVLDQLRKVATVALQVTELWEEISPSTQC